MHYAPEAFTVEEQAVLRRYFTNLDRPVFALVNLPEVVKGALFARYSRSPKSLRRLFLDEFVGDLDVSGDASIDATVGLRLADELFQFWYVRGYFGEAYSWISGLLAAGSPRDKWWSRNSSARSSRAAAATITSSTRISATAIGNSSAAASAPVTIRRFVTRS